MSPHDNMTLNEYQALAKTTAVYPDFGRVLYPLLGLIGEVGEVCDKVISALGLYDEQFCKDLELQGIQVREILKSTAEKGKRAEWYKKLIRKGERDGIALNPSFCHKFQSQLHRILSDETASAGTRKELGDVLWYLSKLSDDLDALLGTVGSENLDKLFDRKDRNVICGDGDNR